MKEHSDQLLQLLTRENESQNMNINENNSEQNLIGIQMNTEQRQSRIGSNGKFYCGGQLNELCRPNGYVGCCDGQCGVTDGCNCSSCM